jgi:hypothetical protein
VVGGHYYISCVPAANDSLDMATSSIIIVDDDHQPLVENIIAHIICRKGTCEFCPTNVSQWNLRPANKTTTAEHRKHQVSSQVRFEFVQKIKKSQTTLTT